MNVKIKLSASDTPSSNVLLRAVWAELRRGFGTLAWQYMPRRDGSTKTIHFGTADLGLTEPVMVAVEYKKKGIVAAIVFETAASIAGRLQACIDRAHASVEKLELRCYKTALATIGEFADVTTENVSLKSKSPTAAELIVRIPAFDDEDGRVEFTKRLYPIIDIVSVFTNLPLRAAKQSRHEAADGKVRTALQPISPDWLDGHPIVADLLVIPEPAYELLEAIALNSLSYEQQLLVSAAHHFHAALVLERESYSAWGGGVSSELATVLYVSALEVTSMVGAASPEACGGCGQPKHRIAERVRGLVAKCLGEPPARLVSGLYTVRSKYLHAGQLLSTRSYLGTSLPQLDPSGPEHVEMQSPLIGLLNLREYTSFCLRHVARNLSAATGAGKRDGAGKVI